LFDTWKMSVKVGVESYWPRPQVLGYSYNYDYTEKLEQRGLTAIPFIEVKGDL